MHYALICWEETVDCLKLFKEVLVGILKWSKEIRQTFKSYCLNQNSVGEKKPPTNRDKM